MGINTVDKYQGDERDFILASYAVSDKDFISSEEDFILSARRFNVTLTRARKKFILLISKSLIEYLSDDIDIAKEGSSLQMFVSS
ncbi:AAA domain-containing protein, partial [Aliarcobacter butzleri]